MNAFRRFVFLALGCSAAATGVVIGCSSEDGTTTPATSDAEPGEEDGRTSDAVVDAANDAGLDGARDADARAAKDANGPGEAGATCSFNRDCQLALRCECNNGDCVCAPGARGTGENGIDGCDSGNDCSSALCLEGPGGAYLCSDECDAAADCPTKLPRCIDVAFVGRVCVRQP